MQNSNEKSKEYCKECLGSYGEESYEVGCIKKECPCHKPSVEVSKCNNGACRTCHDGINEDNPTGQRGVCSSVEVSKCCGAERGKASGNILFDNTCVKCGKRFEPQSIPLDRDERGIYTCDFCGEVFNPMPNRTKVTHVCFSRAYEQDMQAKANMEKLKDSLSTTNLTPENTEMEEWMDRFYGLYMKGRKEGEKAGTIDYFEARHFIYSLLSSHSQKLISELINELESNPNEDGSTSPNLQHWIERKQRQLRKHYQ